MRPIYPDANLTWWKLLLPAVTRGPVWVGWEVPTLRWLLTYWGRNKMATFCRRHFQVRFLDADVGNLIQIYSNFPQASTGQYVPQMALVTHTQTHIHTHLCTYIDGLVRERRSSIIFLTHWNYVFRALTHWYDICVFAILSRQVTRLWVKFFIHVCTVLYASLSYIETGYNSPYIDLSSFLQMSGQR